MSEIVTRGTPPAVPTPESLGMLLARYLRVESILVDWDAREITIDGGLLPVREAADVADFRRALLESLDALIALATEAGATWAEHPEVFISGRVIHLPGGRQEFARVEGRVKLRLWLPVTA